MVECTFIFRTSFDFSLLQKQRYFLFCFGFKSEGDRSDESLEGWRNAIKSLVFLSLYSLKDIPSKSLSYFYKSVKAKQRRREKTNWTGADVQFSEPYGDFHQSFARHQNNLIWEKHFQFATAFWEKKSCLFLSCGGSREE